LFGKKQSGFKPFRNRNSSPKLAGVVQTIQSLLATADNMSEKDWIVKLDRKVIGPFINFV